MFLWYFLYVLIFSSIFCRSEICTEENCFLPSCQCPISNDYPTTLDFDDLPQFVLFTFVGNLSKESLEPIRTILNSSYRNPNKCPITSTFFVHDDDTEYCLVQRLFDNQHEIALSTSSNKCPLTNCYNETSWKPWTDDDWYEEIKQQYINLAEHAHIHQSHIKGFRVPYLQIDDNKHFKYLKQFHFHYDSSILFKSSSLIWPFTHTYPVDLTDCVNCQESSELYETLWQFPLHEWAYPYATDSCRTFFDSSCLPTNQSDSVDILFDFLMYNFKRHTSQSLGNRSPFNIQLDLAILSQQNNTHLQALIRFTEYILKSSDYRYVYFVSIEKALEWFKYPRSISELRNFWAFSCDKKIYDYDLDCPNLELNSSEQVTARSSKDNNTISTDRSTTIDYPLEKLFPNDLVFHALWISFLLILSVLFYDKYFTNA